MDKPRTGKLKRAYCEGDTKMVSMRLPEKLWAEIEAIAKANGHTATTVVATFLDEMVQHEKAQAKRSR